MAKSDSTKTDFTQTDDVSSTGAVEYAAPGTTEVSHYTEDVVVRVATPGPVTVTTSWLSDATVKVVEAPAADAPSGATVAEVQ